MDKLGAGSNKCIFIGYPKKTKRYYFYLTDEQKVFISLKAVFLEKKFFRKGINASKVELDEVQQVKLTQSSETIKLDLIESNLDLVVEAPLRRSDRVSCQPNRYYSFLVRDGDPIELDENNEDLITYMDAIQRSDSDKWLEAISLKCMDIS